MRRELTEQEEREIEIALMQWASDCEYMEMMANRGKDDYVTSRGALSSPGCVAPVD